MQIRPLIALLRLDKPVGIALLLWPTLTALWLAHGTVPPLGDIVLFSLGCVMTRTAGCVVNDIADRGIDKQVARTAHRPLAAGSISLRHAVMCAVFLWCCAALLVPFLSYRAQLLVPIAIAIAALYPFCKRFMPIPQCVLGVAFALGIPMAYLHVLGDVPMVGWFLFIAVYCWIVAYDTFYACADRTDDARIGVRSSALFFGRFTLGVCVFLWMVYCALLLAIGIMQSFGALYFFGIAVAVCIFICQYRLAEQQSAAAYLRAFHHNQWVGISLFVAVCIETL